MTRRTHESIYVEIATKTLARFAFSTRTHKYLYRVFIKLIKPLTIESECIKKAKINLHIHNNSRILVQKKERNCVQTSILAQKCSEILPPFKIFSFTKSQYSFRDFKAFYANISYYGESRPLRLPYDVFTLLNK